MKRKLNFKIVGNIFIWAVILGSIIFLINCSEDVTPSLYDQVGASPPPPVISNMSPAQGLAGVTVITITGSNFSPVLEDNFVYFKDIPANVLEASETQLIVTAPNLVRDSIEVKVAVHKVEDFSNIHLYKLEAAVIEVFEFADFQDPYAITSDLAGNIYVSLVETNSGKGIKKLTPAGELLDFAPKGGETFYNGLKYTTGDVLYGVRGVRAIFEITEGNAPATFAVLDNGTAMLDLDFDENNNIWTGGTGGKIYRVTPDKDVKSFDFEPSVNSIRVFNNYIYVAATGDNSEDIWRFQMISSDSLGAAELYFPFSANFPLISTKAITFSADGDLYIGTDNSDPVVVVYPDRSFAVWYEGVLAPSMISFAWSTGNQLYMTRAKSDDGSGGETTQTIFSVNMERAGAPYFGRD